MKASVITETGRKEVIAVEDVSKPEPEEEEILVDVEASAVNHTDVWIRRGYEGDPPIVTGIDVAGVVAETGAAVDRFEIGDRMVLYWNTTYCGECEFCNDGETTLCRDYGGLGVKRDGGHAEYVAVGATMGEFGGMLETVFEGHLTPVIDEVIELTAIPRAHERIESGERFGKIVVKP